MQNIKNTDIKKGDFISFDGGNTFSPIDSICDHKTGFYVHKGNGQYQSRPKLERVPDATEVLRVEKPKSGFFPAKEYDGQWNKRGEDI